MPDHTWTTPDGAHRAWIGHRSIRTADGHDGSMPFGRCSCEIWEGPSRLREADAIQDVMAHLAEATHA